MDTFPECYVSHVRQLMIRVMRWYRRLCSDLLAFTLVLGKPREISVCRLSMKAVRPVIASNGVPYSKWGRYNRTARQVGGRKEGKNERSVGTKGLFMEPWTSAKKGATSSSTGSKAMAICSECISVTSV
jgi:hypothetical protein